MWKKEFQMKILETRPRPEGWKWKIGVKRKNGEIFWADLIITAIYDNSHNVIAFTKITRDLTEKNRQNEIIQQAKAAKLKSIFLTNMSHELRTPLNGVITAAVLLKDMVMQNEEEKELISYIITSGNSMSKLLHDILDYTDLQVDPPILLKQKFDLVEETQSVIASYKFALKPLVNMRCDFNKDVPRYVVGDRARYRQIISNIVDNACKFTEQGYIYMKVSVLDKATIEGSEESSHSPIPFSIHFIHCGM